VMESSNCCLAAEVCPKVEEGAMGSTGGPDVEPSQWDCFVRQAHVLGRELRLEEFRRERDVWDVIRDLKVAWDKVGEPDSGFVRRMHELNGNRDQGEVRLLLLGLIEKMVEYARRRGSLVGN